MMKKSEYDIEACSLIDGGDDRVACMPRTLVGRIDAVCRGYEFMKKAG
jgi:hypothetical protein